MIPQDRRSSPRVDTGNLIIHSHVGAPSKIQSLGVGVTLDINEFGARVQYATSFTVGDRYRFSIAIGDELVEAVGRIVHVSQALNGTFEAGIEFLEVSERGVEIIRRHGRKTRA